MAFFPQPFESGPFVLLCPDCEALLAVDNDLDTAASTMRDDPDR